MCAKKIASRITHIVRWITSPEQLRSIADEIEKDAPVTCITIANDVELLLVNPSFSDKEEDPDTLQAMDEADEDNVKRWKKVL
jgi:hypothetical protein